MADHQTACAHCGQEAAKRCGSCRNAQYCSAECQQADWQYHKILCKSYADFAEKPSADVRRAIYFPEDGEKPYFIWLPVSSADPFYGKTPKIWTTGDNGQISCDVPERDTQAGFCLPTEDNPVGKFGVDASAIGMVCGKLRRGEHLDHSLSMMVRVDRMSEAPNTCLRRLAKRTIEPKLFRGPLILIAMNKVKLSDFVVDVDTNDLTLALDAAMDMVGPGIVPHHAKKVMAVKVNSAAPFFEEIKIPKRHPAFTAGKVSQIGEMMSTPMRAWFYHGSSDAQTSSATSKDTEAAPPFNAKTVHLCIDPASPDFGRVPEAIQNDTRSMLMVRPPNKIDLGIDIAHLARLCQNVGDLVAPYLAVERGGTPAERLQKANGIIEEIWGKANALMKGFGLSDKDYKFPGC